jgi:hypothetical protein
LKPKKKEKMDKKAKRRITGLFTLRRSSGSVYEKPQSVLRVFVHFFSATFLQPCPRTFGTMLRKALLRAAGRMRAVHPTDLSTSV